MNFLSQFSKQFNESEQTRQNCNVMQKFPNLKKAQNY